jgi:hypothetical protein
MAKDAVPKHARRQPEFAVRGAKREAWQLTDGAIRAFSKRRMGERSATHHFSNSWQISSTPPANVSKLAHA